MIKETIPLLAIRKPLPFPRFPLRKQSIDHFRTYSEEGPRYRRSRNDAMTPVRSFSDEMNELPRFPPADKELFDDRLLHP